MRLNKYLAECSVCSRREADRLIDEGRVTVNGKTAVVGTQVGPRDTVLVNGKKIVKAQQVLLAYYKPKGIVSSTKHNDKAKTVTECVDIGTRIYPIGRLDKDSEGLLLLTNMGELAERIAKAGDSHEKEYIVKVKRVISGSFIDRMRRGVTIELPSKDRESEEETYLYTTKPCKCERIDDHTMRVILTEGKNRQIRRMCEALGQKVINLKRVRIMDIELGDLKPGEWRYIRRNSL